MLKKTFTVALAFIALFNLSSCGKADLEPHTTADGKGSYSVLFNICCTNTGGDVTGSFGDMTAEIAFSDKKLDESYFNVTIQVESIDTGIGARDNHLRNPDFFEVETYPTITFKSTKVEENPSGGYIVTGDMTMKDVTKEISIPFTVNDSDASTTYTGSITVNRIDYNVGESGGAIKDDTTVTITYTVNK